jgi:DegT/DnrJ/EryC1/StrS aminotransferase family
MTTVNVLGVAATVAGVAAFWALSVRYGRGGQIVLSLAQASRLRLKTLEFRARSATRGMLSAHRESADSLDEGGSALAAAGGRPVRTLPPPAWPTYEKDFNQWTGSLIGEFERNFAARIGANFALAVTNGSLALKVALRGLWIGPGDEVVVPSRSFIASASSVTNFGATRIYTASRWSHLFGI